MELKYICIIYYISNLLSINRTFMELKCACVNRYASIKIVLIVPLWN
jgi:hypothetical protein